MFNGVFLVSQQLSVRVSTRIEHLKLHEGRIYCRTKLKMIIKLSFKCNNSLWCDDDSTVRSCQTA